LVSLGGGVSAIDVTPQQQLVPGYPLGGFWATPADSVVDLNGDGIIGSKEVFFDSKAPRQYVGTALPTRSLALMSSFGLTRGMRFWTQFDYEGGHRKYDFTERLRCQGGTCRPLTERNAPMEDKEKAAVACLYPEYRYAFIEDASFLKWRELGLELTLPARWSKWAHAGSMLFSLAVRNVATLTAYPGLDPEASRAQDNFVQADFYTQPQVRHFVARLTVDF
jgi:hypothetical protein